MKRPSPSSMADENEDTNSKKPKQHDPTRQEGLSRLDDNLMFEVFKHVDARTLGVASCVSKQWHKTAQDERLWELMCTRHWANSNHQLRSVVLALGGFKRLHSLYIWPLTKPQLCSSSSSVSSSSGSALSPWATAEPLKPVIASTVKPRWGKDEMNLSLSLLSIRFYEKMNYRGKGRS